MKEAIRVLNAIRDEGGWTDNAYDSLALAIEALEKQMPKKPKRYIAFDGIERNGCPSCPENEILYAGQKFCSVCGQAIDWGVSE